MDLKNLHTDNAKLRDDNKHQRDKGRNLKIQLQSEHEKCNKYEIELNKLKHEYENPMGTNCAPLVAALFLFCNERAFMTSLSGNNPADIIEAFNSTIDNPYFEGMVNQIYPPELQLNKA